MKKTFALLLIAILTLTATAFAATYAHGDDIRFEYDENTFQVTLDDHTDDEDLVVLTGRDAAWGETSIRIHLKDLEDNERFPTLESFTAMPGAGEVTQGEWNGFRDVFMYTVQNEGAASESYFVAPVIDDDGEIEDILTVVITVSPIEDEAAAMARDDQISAVLDSLKLDD